MFTGTFTALITPFKGDESIDEDALRSLVEAQIEAGITGLVPVGTTGESPTVTHEENLKVIEIVVDQAKGRVPVIAGTGSNSTAEAIQMTRKAKEIGADASLQVAPYYNKPNQDGFYRHFTAIADAVDLPMVVYNIPGRTGKNIETETLMRLAEHPNIVAVKEASGSIPQIMEVAARKPEGFDLLSGDDNLAFSVVALGGSGVVSVASNAAPGPVGKMIKLALEGKLEKARAEHYRLLPLFKMVFFDTNPIPIKYAMSLLGYCKEVYRLPLCELSEENKEKVKSVLENLTLLES
ncbi:MAG: 4-hydroxy-tetrahydrodipicolinate synthase [Alkalispirochaetaceae bacterium]